MAESLLLVRPKAIAPGPADTTGYLDVACVRCESRRGFGMCVTAQNGQWGVQVSQTEAILPPRHPNVGENDVLRPILGRETKDAVPMPCTSSTPLSLIAAGKRWLRRRFAWLPPHNVIGVPSAVSP